MQMPNQTARAGVESESLPLFAPVLFGFAALRSIHTRFFSFLQFSSGLIFKTESGKFVRGLAGKFVKIFDSKQRRLERNLPRESKCELSVLYICIYRSSRGMMSPQ